MAKRFRNRTSKEWRAVLEYFGFKWTKSNGDDEVHTHEKCDLVVLVPMRNESIIQPTSEDMARKVSICLGISKKEILKWWKDNGYSE